MSKGQWDEFMARLDAVYLPSLTPHQRQLPKPDEGVPDDVWRAALIIFPSPGDWLDNPIPQLQGKSAREACAAGRADEVRAIMQGVAEFFLPPPDEVIPYEELGRSFEEAVDGEDG
ncbi:MAG: hypothetical protein CSA24_02070 [Deltaproteobacteria bacterium]|nr:MAG: hypothetical protein CSA24_02070 [Deltaproteobacteria bacterium]